MTIDYFVEKCQGVYFATDDYSETTFIITNFCLYGIFMEYQTTEIGQLSKDEYRYYVQLCKDNLEAALGNLNILMPATFDSIAALALGVSFMIITTHPRAID